MKKLAMIVIMLAITTLTIGTLVLEYSGQTALALGVIKQPPPCVAGNPGSAQASGHIPSPPCVL